MIAMGVHSPEEPIDHVEFSCDYYTHAPKEKEKEGGGGEEGEGGVFDYVSVFANGLEFPLVVTHGSSSHGIYRTQIQLESIPLLQILKGEAPCIMYHFRAERGGVATSAATSAGSRSGGATASGGAVTTTWMRGG